VKANQRNFADAAPRAAASARIFFFCGPDEAGAHDGAMRIVSLLAEPGERVELSGAELRKDPVRLGDEARSTSLFGAARHILVRAQGEEAHDAIANLIEGDVDPCPVLIVATGATDKSRSAKLLADRSDALVAMFYPPDLQSVTRAVRAMADAAGLRMGEDVATRIARASGLDTRLAQAEVSKLALYLDADPASPRTAQGQALDAIGATTEDDSFTPLVNAVLGGDSRSVPDEIGRLRELGLNPVGVLLAFERRVAQLTALAAMLRPGTDPGNLIEAEAKSRRVFWNDKADLAAQLRRWRGRRLERLAERLVALHRALMANSQDAELLLAQGLTEIARAAAQRA
jgi:DNA polymerase-3 subunit delta